MAIAEFVKRRREKDYHMVLLSLSHYYEQGALSKYGERNWEKGLPISSYVDSGVRHYLKHQAGHTDERHDLAFLWNIFGALWTLRNKLELMDLPIRRAVKLEVNAECL